MASLNITCSNLIMMYKILNFRKQHAQNMNRSGKIAKSKRQVQNGFDNIFLSSSHHTVAYSRHFAQSRFTARANYSQI